MEKFTSCRPSPNLPSFPLLPAPVLVHRRPPLLRRRVASEVERRRRGSAAVRTVAAAGSRGRDFGGELVDENMAALRKRICELRRAEEGEEGPPSHWAEWEKRHYASYAAVVCAAVEMLRDVLLKTRPSTALAVAVLVALSFPVSMVMVFLQSAGVIDEILRGSLIQ